MYRFRDPKLLREVAIKVLPSEVAQDPQRLSRFRREAFSRSRHGEILAVRVIAASYR